MGTISIRVALLLSREKFILEFNAHTAGEFSARENKSERRLRIKWSAFVCRAESYRVLMILSGKF
jgi:hypothetical protein